MLNINYWLDYLIHSENIYILMKMFFAMTLGGIIGLERELKHKPVGIKTCIIIAVTTCILTIVSIKSAEHYAQVSENIRTDPMRLAAQVISGIGFLGAGVILRKTNDAISGLTTAAIIWAAAGVGIATGAGFFFDAFIATIIILMAIRISPRIRKLVRSGKKSTNKSKIILHIETPLLISEIISILTENNYLIENISIKDQTNNNLKLTIKCNISSKAMIQGVYTLLREKSGVLSIDLEN
ncbi:putative Mg2+ transporter-C (MgtC) family protein [Bisgaardia hudsonensis]|uniref:Protein MgtC n=1 Tax=Bisgaardia hudsonensis TaxID=109472 RepID=A0A4R2MWC1_9PAST|nr:MgtC/SapB family protein [Bisgaardia hudsonensis]QLB13858.1 hypothetical protein A6A11_09660 [Bisgaardia hudsonensis]TCP11657.1 putative Mg2+ transporter-C (MgtC) family protein [Bisgaardia hudsonensis]